MAQSVAHILGKDEVTSSILVISTITYYFSRDCKKVLYFKFIFLYTHFYIVNAL